MNVLFWQGRGQALHPLHRGVGHWPELAGAWQLPAVVMGVLMAPRTRQLLLGFEWQEAKISLGVWLS